MGQDELLHYGVPGMKWGRRRYANHVAKKEAERKARDAAISDDHRERTRIKSKRIEEMSNAELKKVNERLQLERKYKELATDDLSRGQKFIHDLLLNSAKQTAQQQTSKYMTKAAEAAIARAIAM